MGRPIALLPDPHQQRDVHAGFRSFGGCSRTLCLYRSLQFNQLELRDQLAGRFKGIRWIYEVVVLRLQDHP